MGLYMYGQHYVESADDFALGGTLEGTNVTGAVGPSEEFSLCFDLLSCFTTTIDHGLRTGDIVDSAMDSAFFTDGQSYIDRVIFGLVFLMCEPNADDPLNKEVRRARLSKSSLRGYRDGENSASTWSLAMLATAYRASPPAALPCVGYQQGY